MNEFTIYEEKDPTFVQDLQASVEAVEFAAQYVRERWRCRVTIFPIKVRERVSDMAACSDAGDFDAHIDGLDYRVDPKRCQTLKNDFTCQADFPFRRLLVCNCHQWDKREPKTFIYLNIAMTAAAITRPPSSWSWKAWDYYDHGKRRWRRGYFCPLDQIEFVQL